MAGNKTHYCAACGERIGVYEPIWLQDADGNLASTSLLNLDEHLGSSEDQPRLFHLRCLGPDEFAQTHVG